MKPTLMLLPGLLCDRTVWEPQIEAFGDRFRCEVPDYEFADSLSAMAEHVLHVAPDSFAMAGHSMGGRVALEVMRRAPERVSRLALLDTGYKALPEGEAGQREVEGRMRLVKMAREHGMRVMGQEWLQGMVHPDRLDDDRLCGAILDMIASKTPEIFERQIHALIQRPDGTDVLERIQCPTTFICGAEDNWSPLERHYQMAERVPGSEVIAIADSGHMSTMERPEAMNRAFERWLAQSPTTA